MGNLHISVLTEECISYMNCRPNGIYVDATAGNGGHSMRLLQSCPSIARLIAIDCDAEAVERTRKKLGDYAEQATVLHGNFRDLDTLLESAGVTGIDGILFDLGVSTNQLKDPGRGFSFMANGTLDMRMDSRTPLTARDLLLRLSAEELEQIIRDYGEERWARKIARAVKRHLQEQRLETTLDLAGLVSAAIPARHHPRTIHPATKTFQALRIAVNGELDAIALGLDKALALLRTGGRLCVISFHSLEDRIVKTRIARWEKSCSCPPGIPVCICANRRLVKRITRKPVVPSAAEQHANPKARSAKLRVAEKV